MDLLDPQVLEVLSGTLESRVKLDKEDSQDFQECLELLDQSDPKEAGVTLVILVSQELEVWDLQVEQDPQGPLDPRALENLDPREKGVLLENQAREDYQGDLDPLDPLGIVNFVTVLLPRQTNRPIKKALKLITIPGQVLIGPARTAQLPMLQGRLPRILPRAWQPNWWQGHAQYHDYNQYYLFCAQYYNHVNPFIIDLNIQDRKSVV